MNPLTDLEFQGYVVSHSILTTILYGIWTTATYKATTTTTTSGMMVLEGFDPVAELSMTGKTPCGKTKKVHNRNEVGVVRLHLSKTLIP